MSAHGLDRNSAPDRRIGSQLNLAAGDKAIYPGLGPCRIGGIEKKMVDGRAVAFYQMIVLDDSGGELFIPVEKAPAIGIRSLMKKHEIPELLGQLKKRSKGADNWCRRASDNSKLLRSGSPFDLAEIVTSLTELSDTKSLSLGESRTLGKARRLLVCEISEVLGEPTATVEAAVDQALNAEREGIQ